MIITTLIWYILFYPETTQYAVGFVVFVIILDFCLQLQLAVKSYFT